MQPLSRDSWVQSCQFHSVSATEVFSEVTRRVLELNQSVSEVPSLRPLVLLDLDSTLYEVGPRTFRIVQEWLGSSHSSFFPEVTQAFRSLTENQIGYSIRDLFLTLRLSPEKKSVQDAFHSLKDFWLERFFTTGYLPYDRPYVGAAQFTQNLHQLGAEIVYLTGRDEPYMGDGTRANLVRDGFPWGVERTHLLMKSDRNFPDLEHKKGAANFVRRQGALVASFENEPVNLVALYDLFPDAMHVFVETVCSDHEAPARKGLYRITGFEDFS